MVLCCYGFMVFPSLIPPNSPRLYGDMKYILFLFLQQPLWLNEESRNYFFAIHKKLSDTNKRLFKCKTSCQLKVEEKRQTAPYGMMMKSERRGEIRETNMCVKFASFWRASLLSFVGSRQQPFDDWEMENHDSFVVSPFAVAERQAQKSHELIKITFCKRRGLLIDMYLYVCM